MVMLHRESKVLVIISFLFVIVSCNKYKEYDSKETARLRDRILSMSLHHIGQTAYWTLYGLANDSIINWQRHQLGLWKYYGNGINYQLDSIFCVNNSGDKIILSILRQNLDENATESIWYFYGVKINNQWYFYGGPTLVLPREFYQEDIHTPLSFEKLQQIATAHIYRGYLKKGKKGQWEINERFFQDIISKNKRIGGYGSCLNCKTEEEYVLYRVRKNWQQRDTTNYEK